MDRQMPDNVIPVSYSVNHTGNKAMRSRNVCLLSYICTSTFNSRG